MFSSLLQIQELKIHLHIPEIVNLMFFRFGGIETGRILFHRDSKFLTVEQIFQIKN